MAENMAYIVAENERPLRYFACLGRIYKKGEEFVSKHSAKITTFIAFSDEASDIYYVLTIVWYRP